MIRAVVAAVACATALLAGCTDDDQPAGPTRVTTTQVQVVEGLGEKGGFDPAAIYRRLSPGVVTVLSIFDRGSSLIEDGGEGGQGSGFVLDGSGYVATNAHVVLQGQSGDPDDRADQVYVEFSDGNRVRADIVGVDPNADVAVLKVDPRGLELTPLPLGHSDHIVVGEPVAAIGSPFGERQSLSIGVISAVDRTIESLTRFTIGNAIQTDAAINPGNSGGPLLSARGRVLGINAQIKTRSGGGEGVGFAIPIDTVRRSLRELRHDGTVDYAFLGVTTFTLWPQLAERLHVPAEQGALIQQVEPGSPADEAGLRPSDSAITFQGQSGVPVGGDVIVAVDDTRLTREQDLADVIAALPAGRTVQLRVLRDGKERTIEVKLAGRNSSGSG